MKFTASVRASRGLRGGLTSWMVVAALCASESISAQTEAELAAAREAYREGISLQVAGNWASALAKFQVVASVRSTPQVRFHIARCQENLGRWNEALGGYRIALTEARALGSDDVVTEVQRAHDILEKKIPRVVFEAADGKSFGAVRVVLDGVELGSSALAGPVPVDPGGHSVQIRSPYGAASSVSFDIETGENRTLTLDVPRSEDLFAKTPVEPTSDQPVRRGDDGGSSVVPWLVTGVGGASLVASGVFFALRADTLAKLEQRCDPGFVCAESDRKLHSTGQTYTTAGNIALGVGAVGVVVGTILLLSTGSESEPTVESRGWTVHPGGGGFAWTF